MHPDAAKTISRLAKGGKNIRAAFSTLRAKADARAQAEILAKIDPESSEAKEFLTGQLFAFTWKGVWNYKLLPPIENSQKAVNWFAIVIERHAISTQAHINLRNQLNTAVLLGHWSEAREILEQHRSELGLSMWSMAWGFLLAEEDSGLRRREDSLETIASEENGPVLRVLAHLFRTSADKAFPEEQFRSTLNGVLPPSNRPFRQFMEVLFLEETSDKWEAWELLQFAEVLPLVDRYEIFLRLTSIALAEKHADAPKLFRTIARLNKSLIDECLNYVVESFDNSHAINSNGCSVELIQAWDAFMIGDYINSQSIANALALKRPELLAVHEILVKSALYLQQAEQLTGGTPIALLWHHLKNIFSKNESSEDSLNFLNRFSSRFRIYSLTAPIRALYTQHWSAQPDEIAQRRASYTFCAHGPRNFEYGHAPIENALYLNHCERTFTSSDSIYFFKSLSEGTPGLEVGKCENIPNIRRYFFGGLAAARRQSRNEALSYLSTFLELQSDEPKNPLSPFAIEEARRVLIDLYRTQGNPVKMQEVVVQAFLDRVQAVRRLPLGRVWEESLLNRSETGKYIEYPIVAYLARQAPHTVSIALRTYLAGLQVEKPSDLIGKNGLENLRLTALLLRVCVPEVLDSLPLLESVEKVEEERLKILRWIAENSQGHAMLAKTEILRLTQNAQLREALENIEGGRVVLNLSGLREAEYQKFSDAYFRYSAQRELATTKRKDEILNVFQNLLKSGNKFAVLSLENPQTIYSAFASAFREVRDAFISSPHFGIEACLSGRIRHGILIQHIRRPLVERRLAVSRDERERIDAEAYWSNRLPGCARNEAAAFSVKVLHKLTDDINAVAETVRSDWIQSKTEIRNPEGLFDYAFSDVELNHIHDERMTDVTSVERFIDVVFDILLHRTKESLPKARKMVIENLQQMLSGCVDDALQGLRNDALEVSFQALRNDLTAYRMDTEHTCRQMSRWFQGTDATLADVDFERVANTAVGMVEMLNPDFRKKHVVSVSSPYKVRSRHFTQLVHMTFFLLDNAIHHSKMSREDYVAKLHIEAEEGFLRISVTNKMPSNKEATEAVQRISSKIQEVQKALDLEKVIREGGTGFAKIIVAVEHEFKATCPVINAVHEGDQITVAVKCNIAGLVS